MVVSAKREGIEMDSKLVDSKLSDEEFHQFLKAKVRQETLLTVEIIELLEESEQRKLYLKKGFGSLLDFCVKDLGYSESAAYRRIQAMRISRQLPEVKAALGEGRLSLVNVAKVQTLFKAEAKNNNAYSVEEKRELIKEIENKTQAQAEKILANESDLVFARERLRAVGQNKTQLTIVLDDEVLATVNKIKSLLSHRYPHANYNDIIKIMGEISLEKLDPSREKRRKSAPQREFANRENLIPQREFTQKEKSTPQCNSTPLKINPKQNPRYIPAAVKRTVWQKAQSQCSHLDANSNRRCSSTFQLQIDHRIPVAIGGTSDTENLRLVCAAHNQLYARQHFGDSLMDKYLSKKN